MAQADCEPSAGSSGRGWLRIAGWREVFGVDLRTLALFRVGLAAVILTDLGLRAADLEAHYTDFGIMPRSVLPQFLHADSVTLHAMGGSLWSQALLFAIAALFAVQLLVGYRTRLAAVLCWAFLVSLQHRNSMILSGQDNLLAVLSFWSMFLPLGARYSVDAAMNSAAAAPDRYFSIATLALLIQGMSMYLFSALLKSDPLWIPDGLAVHYALQLDHFATPFAHWLRQFDGLLKALTYYVWTLELVGPFLIFLPVFHRFFRSVVMIAFITMHVGFFLCLEIGFFPAVSILMNLTFTPGWVWDWIEGRVRARGAGITMFYDEGCDFCRKACLLLRVMLILPRAGIAPAQQDPKAGPLLVAEDSWVVRDGEGRDRTRSQALRALLAASPVFFPLAALFRPPLLSRVADRVYGLIGANRRRLSRVTAAFLPMRPVRVAAGPLGTVLAGVFLVFVTIQNLSTLPAVPLRLPDWFVSIRQALGIYQNWTMFAPYPEVSSPRPVIVGRLRDGTPVDVYNRRLGEPDWGKPRYVSRLYGNARWRRYLTTLEDLSYDNDPPDFGLQYGRYLCRLWNRDARTERQLQTFEIHFVVEWTRPDHGPKEVVDRLVWSHDCFG